MVKTSADYERAQVFDILTKWMSCKSWEEAFYEVIVRRTFRVRVRPSTTDLDVTQPKRKFEAGPKNASACGIGEEEAGDQVIVEREPQSQS